MANGRKFNRNATVGTSTIKLVDAEPSRKSLYIFNNGASALYLDSTPALTTSTACVVIPAGQSLTDCDTVDAWYAIAGGSLDIRCCEVI